MIGCVYDYTKKYQPIRYHFEPNISRERDTKKKRLRARNARFSGAENTRARTREPAEMAMMTIHNIIRDSI